MTQSSNEYTKMQNKVLPLFLAIANLKRKGLVQIDAKMMEGKYPNDLDHFIAKLCGYKDGCDMAKNFREETQNLFDLFKKADAATAYTLYKALEAKSK